MTGRRGLAVALLVCLAGAALVLLAVARPWVQVTARTAAPTADRPDAFLETTTRYDAGDVAPAVTPLGLLALAGVAALAGTRGRGRQAVGLAILMAGAAISATAARVAADGSGTGVPDPPAGAVDVLAGPWLAVTGGGAVALAGVLAVRRGRRWAALGSAYDGPSAPHSEPTDALGEAWAAVERGDDRT